MMAATGFWTSMVVGELGARKKKRAKRMSEAK